MLNSIKIENNFAHSNVTFTFDKGLTAITGKNGTGKSSILEMIRFALFGSSALRTEAKDYPKTKVTLDFTVRGVNYIVSRTTTKATLLREGDLIASATKPVNLKILEVFGYGLEVFDTANNAAQGEIEALSAMRPAERKRLVDSTVGLTVIDDLAKWCRDEASSKLREANGWGGSINMPDEPIAPEVQSTEADLVERQERLMLEDRERRDLEVILANQPDEPELPTSTILEDAEELETLVYERNALVTKIARNEQAFRNLVPATMIEEQIEDARRLNIQKQAYDHAFMFVRDNKPVSWTKEDIAAWTAELDTWDYYQGWKKLADQGTTTCPSCNHTWFNRAEDMALYGDWEGKEAPPKPTYNSLVMIKKFQLMLDEWLSIKTKWEAASKLIENGPPVTTHTEKELVAAENALLGQAHYLELKATIERDRATLVGMPDRTKDLTARREYDRAVRAWKALVEVAQAWKAEEPKRRQRLAELAPVPGLLAGVMEDMVALRTYTKLRAAYEVAKAKAEASRAKVDALTAEGKELEAAAQALATIKAKVKSYLVPSLSKVASIILAQMTDNALSDVVVNEDFDITVDGKVIDGLSGAGKAAANLALRFGLGQVLTNRVFSVFMADEIDASMDEDRAVFIADCLRNLTQKIGQIILVSHKKPDADNYIIL